VHNMKNHRQVVGKWFNRSLGPWSAWFAMHGCKALLQTVPTSWIPSLGRQGGGLLYRMMGSRRRVAIENMRMALGTQLSPSGRRRVLRGLMDNAAIALMELGHHRYLDEKNLRRCIAVQGQGHLDDALRQGKGAILATAHFGNFPLLLARLALDGHRIGVVFREPRHRPMARFLRKWQDQMGIVALRDKPRWAAVKASLDLLRSNGILVLHVDLNVSRGGVYVPFFGLWVPTFEGPAMLALRSEAPVMPTFIQRLDGLQHRVMIHHAAEIQVTGDRKQDAWQLLRSITRAAETAIREHPDQWLWLHRRFRKARPAEEVGRTLPHMSAKAS
jgi:KDO2-lipid IV(A) lauroyltransferase